MSFIGSIYDNLVAQSVIVRYMEALSTMLNMSAGQFDLQLDNVSAAHSAVFKSIHVAREKGTQRYST